MSMKRILLALLLLISARGYCTNRVQLKISKPFAILSFLRAAANDAHVSTTLIAYVHSHVPKEDSVRFYKLVHKFEEIPWDESIIFTGHPEGRVMPKTVAKSINNAAIQADNIDDFLQRIIGVMPNEQWQKLKEAMLAAEPLFDKIMKPHDAALVSRLNELNKYSDKVDDIFMRLNKFYGSVWSNEIPFTVSLYAIPGIKGNTDA